MSETRTDPIDQATSLSGIPCVTAHPDEAAVAGPAFTSICTGNADLIATSIYCPDVSDGGACGGHPICRPCYELCRARGMLT